MTHRYPPQVRLVEVGPRDGLQNIRTCIKTRTKLTFIEMLGRAGLPAIEVTGCVSPTRVPQLADHEAVLRGLKRLTGISYPCLVPNLKGLETALAAGATEFSLLASASETFSQKNSNCSKQAGLARCSDLAARAAQAGLPFRVYLSCSLGCPYEGNIPTEEVAEMAEQLFDLGCREIVLADTIGIATPGQVQALLAAVLRIIPVNTLAIHFHDTYGQALANILAALEMGVATIDASVAGLGGCPFAPGAAGNVASEDLLYMLDGLGIHTGVRLEELIEAGNFISRAAGRANGARVAHAFRCSNAHSDKPAGSNREFSPEKTE